MFQQFQYFIKLAETGSINKAAQALHMSQPSLTKQLRMLEDEFGVDLFLRSQKGTTLTEQGELLLEEAKRITNRIDYVRQQLRNVKTKEKLVRIGSLPSYATSILPPFIKKLQSKKWIINLTLYDTSAEIYEAYKDGSVDLGLVQDTSVPERIELMEEKYYLILSKEHPLSKYDEVPIEELSGHTLILPDSLCEMRIYIDAFLRVEGMNNLLTLDLNKNSPIISLVENGVGVTILPEMLLKNWNPDRVTYRPILNRELIRKTYYFSSMEQIKNEMENHFKRKLVN